MKLIKCKNGYLMWKHYLRGDFMLIPSDHSEEIGERGYRLVVNPDEELFEDLKTMFPLDNLELIKQ